MSWSKSAFRRWAQRFVPMQNGRLYLPALQHTVTIQRDQWGIPHIRAENRHDLFVAQGFVHAQDRLWQMELNRRAALGTLSAVFGSVTLDTDRLSRALGFGRLAKQTWAQMKQPWRADVVAYTTGVNAFLQSGQPLPLECHLLRHQPDLWQPLDTVAYARLQMWALTEGASGEIITAQLMAQLGEARARELLPCYPMECPVTLPGGIEMNGLRGTAVLPPFLGKFNDNGAGRGSNGWVIAANRSATGHAILCNDMHLPLGTPSIWHYQHLHSEDGLRVTGFTLPGMPYVMVGHNGRIAWGATLSFVDCEDFFVEKLHPEDTTRYEFAGEWRQAERFTEEIVVRGEATHVEEVICTHHGPIIPHFQAGAQAGEALALSSMALRPDLEVDGFGLLNVARGWEDFVTAVTHLQAPSLNLLYADIDDNIGHWVTGIVPIRQNGDGLLPAPGWTGTHEWVGEIPFTEMPHALNPQEGYIVSANHRLVPDAYPHYLGQVWRNGYRAQRIEQLITSRDKVSAADCQRFQLDFYSIPGHRLAQQLHHCRPADEAARTSWQLLVAWDGWLGADSVGGAVYEVFLLQLAEAVLQPQLEAAFKHAFLGAGLHSQLNPVNVFHNYWAATVLRWLEGEATVWLPVSPEREQLLARCLGEVTAVLQERLGDDSQQWQWGRLHQTQFPHVLEVKRPLDMLFKQPAYPIGGDGDTVCQTSFQPDAPYASNAISVSSRHIVEMGNLAAAQAILAPGQSGHVGSPHYDDLLADWRHGRYFVMGWEGAGETAVITDDLLILKPAG
ncbi:MAG: penicillin acylase family protein [Ardenticatenaceae bacterium]|nr:penicillin acylase family protein [Ardenticatenaceae bacterium]